MKVFLCLTTVLLILHAGKPYILLTANMEDVHALANQLVASPVVDQIGKIWRRAANQFQREIRRDTRRRGDSDNGEDSNKESDDDDTRKIVKNIIAFGKNTGYLGHMRRAFEIIDPKLS